MKNFYRDYFKRFLDIIISLLFMPIVLFLIVILGPIIFFTDRGPIFYNAERLGKNGEIFKMYKFRSMKVNSPDVRNIDGSTFNSDNDPRLTKIGKFIRKTSLDEFPQFVNVLKGDMSIIGPRPDLPDAIETLYDDNITQKLTVLPGISGYNQAYYRNTADLTTRFANDIFYANNVSFALDLKIFMKTILSVLKREGVYHGE